MKKVLLTLSLSIVASMGSFAQNEPYKNPKLTPEERAEDLLGRLTLKEKIGLANRFPEYCRVYLNDVPVGNGRQIRIRGYLYDKASRLIPFMAPGMSVSVYVSNIVEEHLKRHGELLKNELECFLYKDSLWKN